MSTTPNTEWTNDMDYRDNDDEIIIEEMADLLQQNLDMAEDDDPYHVGDRQWFLSYVRDQASDLLSDGVYTSDDAFALAHYYSISEAVWAMTDERYAELVKSAQSLPSANTPSTPAK